MNTALDQLLARLLPGTTAAGARVTLRLGSRVASVAVTGIGTALVAVTHGDALALDGTGRAVLSIDVPGAARIEMPVLVVASGRKTTMLRSVAQPLVLRRRVVRDQALAEALGVPAAPAHVAA